MPRLFALMYSVTATLRLNGLDVGRWLAGWLAACACGTGPPGDLSPWLPWSMEAGRRREMRAPA